MFISGKYLTTFLTVIVASASVLSLTQPVEAQTSEFLITNYGAKCNASDDDAPAIRLAVAAAGKAGGGKVVFPDNRTCVIKSEITVSVNNIKLVGSGSGRVDAVATGEGKSAIDYTTKGNKAGQSRIIVNTAIQSRMPSGHPLAAFPFVDLAFNVSGTNFEVSGLRFIGPRIWYKDGIDPRHEGRIIAARKKVTVTNTTFDGIGTAFIRLGSDTELTFDGVHCINWGRSCAGVNKNTVMKNNVFRQTGIGWDGNNPNQPAHDRWSEYANYVYGMGSSGVYNYLFTNNIVEGTRAGVHANGGAQGLRMTKYTITQNTFINNRDSIIGSDFGGGGRWEDVIISNNIFDSDTRNSMYIYKGEGLTIENNIIRHPKDTTGSAIKSGVRLMAHQDDTDIGRVMIRNNTFDAAGSVNWSGVTVYEAGGYRLTLLPQKVYDVTIENNSFLNQGSTRYGAGLYFMKSDADRQQKFTVQCNNFTSTEAAGKADMSAYVRFGSEEGSKPSSFLKDFTIKNNTFTGNGQSRFYGIMTQNSSKITDGKIEKNTFTNFTGGRDITIVSQSVARIDGNPTVVCAPGVVASVTPGASLTASSSTTAPSVPQTETAPAATPTPTPVAAPVTKTAVLSATKTVDKTTVKPGESVTYTITIQNSGEGAASNVRVSDVLDARLTYVSSSDSGKLEGSAVNWTIPTLASKQTKTLTLIVTAK